MRKNEKRRNRWITNGTKNMRIYPDDPLPDGWRDGTCVIRRNTKIWITNGYKDRQIDIGTDIPDGWRRGIHKARNNDMIWIHRGKVEIGSGEHI